MKLILDRKLPTNKSSESRNPIFYTDAKLNAGQSQVEVDIWPRNVRKYPNGKLLIKPSKKNAKAFLGGIRKIIKAALGMSAADLIHILNPKIRGWANYHRHVVTQCTSVRVDHHIFSSL